MSPRPWLVIFLVIASGAGSLSSKVPPTPSTTVIMSANACEEPIWIAVVSAPNSPDLPVAATGFVLLPRESAGVSVPSNWTGYVWARTRCGIHASTEEEYFACLTGNCGSRTVACPRGTPVPPATTIAHFEDTLLIDASDFMSYFVSVATGFNIAVSVTPKDGSGPRCKPTGWSVTDLNKACPKKFQVVDENNGETVGCKSGYDRGVMPNGCISAIYDIQFCAPSFPTYSLYKPYNPEELGSDNHENNNNSSGNQMGIMALKIGLLTISATTIIGILWWVLWVVRNGQPGEGCTMNMSTSCCNCACADSESKQIRPDNYPSSVEDALTKGDK